MQQAQIKWSSRLLFITIWLHTSHICVPIWDSLIQKCFRAQRKHTPTLQSVGTNALQSKQRWVWHLPRDMTSSWLQTYCGYCFWFQVKTTKQPQDACKMLNFSLLKWHFDRVILCFYEYHVTEAFFFLLIPSCSIQLCILGVWESLAQHACYVRQQGVLLTAVTPSLSKNISSRSIRVIRPVQLGESVGASLKAAQMKVKFDQ